MTRGSKSRTSDKPSINYRYNPHRGSFSDLVDVTREDYTPSSHDNTTKQPPKKSESTSPILTTTDLISGANQLWNFATSSLPVLRHRTSTHNTDNHNLQKPNTFYYPAKEGNIIASIPSKVLPTVDVQLQQDLELDSLHVAKKLSSFDCCSDSHFFFHLLRSCKEKRVSNEMILDLYGWMSDIHNIKINGVTSLNESTNDIILPTSSTFQPNGKENEVSEMIEGQECTFVNQEGPGVEICISTTTCKPTYGVGKQEHAFAGAFAGVFVSLCLHPMDTVKTVIQSCHTDQRSIPYIGKSIISERGLSGLYRGIASNIATSAPISAIYTFSYESVKGALLPLFGKEHESLAHCIGGGCASVATSFVFTPSERIKQQMQVGSHYHSCWNAFWGIVRKGGFSSLYNGWGAVVCRNVPHSIIKFYTYESLKSIFSSNQTHGQPTTISTLLCGGLAGSTAALFTTPFDVVKTRLQTQIPGSVNRYNGVFDTLKGISQHEGLKGLYRGLTPRLAMYMTQGALFFASYESFKRLFSMDSS
ncbi:hypothetical protein LXL04_005574 [Taraxacum kok-saghyz]